MSQTIWICLSFGFGSALFQLALARYLLPPWCRLQDDIGALLFTLLGVGAWYSTMAFVAYWLVSQAF